MTSPSHVPPGFRFHPTEEELLNYYLKKKVTSQKIDLDVIREVDLNKLEPWDIQDKCRIGSTPQNDWYFFSHRDKKYPTGIRTNRATAAGFWKATGRDKVIYASSKRIGMRKTLVFYKGRAPHGQKSDWIMHEYRHYDQSDSTISQPMTTSETTTQEGWVVCRVFKKRNHCKIRESPEESMVNGESTASFFDSYNNGTLEQILQHIGSTCKQETKVKNNNPLDIKSVQLPQPPRPTCYSSFEIEHQQEQVINVTEPFSTNHSGYVEPPAIAGDWATLDRIVASHLIGQDETAKNLVCFNDPTLRSQPFPHLFNAHDQELQFHQHGSTTMLLIDNNQDYNSDIDLWSFDRSSPPSRSHTLNNGVMSTTASG